MSSDSNHPKLGQLEAFSLANSSAASALAATISPRIASVPRVGSIIGTRDSDEEPVSNTIESQLAVTT